MRFNLEAGTSKRPFAIIRGAQVAGSLARQQGTVILSGYLRPVVIKQRTINGVLDYTVNDSRSTEPLMLASWRHSNFLQALPSYSTSSYTNRRPAGDTKEKLAGEFSSDAILEDTCNAYLIALVNETVPESGPSSDWSVVKCLVIRRSSSDNPRYCRIGLVSMLALDWFGDAVWQSKRMAKWYHTLRPFKETLARVGPQLDHQNQAGLALDDWSADVPPLSRLEEKAANLEWGTVTIE